MLLHRAILHSLIILLVVTIINVVATAGKLPGVLLVFSVITTGHGLLFAFSTGFVANRQKAGVLVIAIVGILLLWPPNGEHLVATLVPIAAGVVVGTMLHKLITQGTRIRRTHGRSTQSVHHQPSGRNDDGPADLDPGSLERPRGVRRSDVGTLDD